MFIEVKRGYLSGRFTTPKSNKMRKVDMGPQLFMVLRRYLVQRKEEGLRKGWGEPPEVLFYNEEGRVLDSGYFGYKVFQKWLKKAGLRGVTFHSLRHTYANPRL